MISYLNVVERSLKAQAFLWKILSYSCFAMIAAMIRYLTCFSSQPLSPVELAFFETIFGVLFLGAATFSGGKKPFALQPFFTKAFECLRFHPILTVMRSVCVAVGLGLWCVALKYLPLPLLCVFKLLSPLLTVVAAHGMLKEKVCYPRVLALASCLLTTCLMFLKQFQLQWQSPLPSLTWCSMLLPVVALLALTAAHILGKRLLKTRTSFSVTFSLLCLVSVFLAIPAWLTWVTPTIQQLPWLGVLGGVSGIAYYALNRALQLADLSFLMPLSFLRFILGTGLGYLCFSETLSPWLVLWIALSATFTLWFLSHEKA